MLIEIQPIVEYKHSKLIYTFENATESKQWPSASLAWAEIGLETSHLAVYTHTHTHTHTPVFSPHITQLVEVEDAELHVHVHAIQSIEICSSCCFAT